MAKKKGINCPVCDSFDLSTLLQKVLTYAGAEVRLGFTEQTSPLRKCNKCGEEFIIVSSRYPDIFAIAKSISKEVPSQVG